MSGHFAGKKRRPSGQEIEKGEIRLNFSEVGLMQTGDSLEVG